MLSNNKNTVSLHIRRGDYLKQQHNHPVQSLEFYNKALELIGDYENLLIFSDDIDWCEKNLNYSNMTFVKGLTDIENIWLMSMCQHNIMANSSFSWWGAWLNNNPNKIVVSPKLWFGNNLKLNTKDIIPKDWIKI